MSRRLINPAALHPAPGYSHVAESRGGRVLHFAGQVALDAQFHIVGDNIYSQTVAAMTNVKSAMDEVNIGWEDIVRRTIYTLHPTEYETISRAIEEVTGGGGQSTANHHRRHGSCPAGPPDRDRVHRGGGWR